MHFIYISGPSPGPSSPISPPIVCTPPPPPPPPSSPGRRAETMSSTLRSKVADLVGQQDQGIAMGYTHFDGSLERLYLHAGGLKEVVDLHVDDFARISIHPEEMMTLGVFCLRAKPLARSSFMNGGRGSPSAQSMP